MVLQKKNQSNDNAKAKNKESSGSVKVVMKIDLHCDGCAAKFVKAILSISGNSFYFYFFKLKESYTHYTPRIYTHLLPTGDEHTTYCQSVGVNPFYSFAIVFHFNFMLVNVTIKNIFFFGSHLGVESVKRLENDDLKKITVIGKVDPDELRQKVEKKINRKVELISPVTKNQKDGDGEQKKQQNQQIANDNKPVKVITLVIFRFL